MIALSLRGQRAHIVDFNQVCSFFQFLEFLESEKTASGKFSGIPERNFSGTVRHQKTIGAHKNCSRIISVIMLDRPPVERRQNMVFSAVDLARKFASWNSRISGKFSGILSGIEKKNTG